MLLPQCRYVELDPELPGVLLDMKESGKTLMLITNSDWPYTNGLMSFAYDRCALGASSQLPTTCTGTTAAAARRQHHHD